MAEAGIGDRTATALIAEKEELARTITASLYAEMPGLLEKYGERGRARCLEDMRYNLEHLAPAVALDEPILFSRYVLWLRDMLAARRIPVDEVRRSLELTRDIVRQRFPPEGAELLTRVLDAGLEVLGADPGD